MDKNKISHDILNVLERLRIMHEIAKSGQYSEISKDELKKDLKESLKEIEKNFEKLLQ